MDSTANVTVYTKLGLKPISLYPIKKVSLKTFVEWQCVSYQHFYFLKNINYQFSDKLQRMSPYFYLKKLMVHFTLKTEDYLQFCQKFLHMQTLWNLK